MEPAKKINKTNRSKQPETLLGSSLYNSSSTENNQNVQHSMSYRGKLCSDTFSSRGSLENHLNLAHSGGAKQPRGINVALSSPKRAKSSHYDFMSVSDGPAESPSGKENVDTDRQILTVLGNNEVVASPTQRVFTNASKSINSIRNTECNSEPMASRLSDLPVSVTSTPSELEMPYPVLLTKATLSDSQLGTTPSELEMPYPVLLTKATLSDSQLGTDSSVICEICDAHLEDLKRLRVHVQRIHKVKIHSKKSDWCKSLDCQNCELRFFTDQGLERHLLCAHGLVTSNMQELENENRDAGRCAICGRVYSSKLVAHISEFHKVTLKPAHLSYKCKVCSESFILYGLLENHVNLAHSRVGKRPSFSKSTSSKQITKLSCSEYAAQSDLAARRTSSEQNRDVQKLMSPVLRSNKVVASPAPCDFMHSPSSINSLPNVACNSQGMSEKLFEQPISITQAPSDLQGAYPVSLQKATPNDHETNGFVVCEMCDTPLKGLMSLGIHMQLEHKMKVDPGVLESRRAICCHKCQQRFFTHEGLERHLLFFHGLITSSMQELVKRSEDAGCCTFCGMMYPSKIVAHMRKVHQLTLRRVDLI